MANAGGARNPTETLNAQRPTPNFEVGSSAFGVRRFYCACWFVRPFRPEEMDQFLARIAPAAASDKGWRGAGCARFGGR